MREQSWDKIRTLAHALKAGPCEVRTLAKAAGVGPRTIYRYIGILKLAGAEVGRFETDGVITYRITNEVVIG